MKNQSNYFITHTKEMHLPCGTCLKASFDIDSKKELINFVTVESSTEDASLLNINWPNFPLSFDQFFKALENQSIDYKIHYLLTSFFLEYVGLKAIRDSNDDICLCFGVKESTIVELIKSSETPKMLNEIIDLTEATTACGKCLPNVLNLYFDKLNEKFQFLDDREEMFFSHRGMSYPELLIAIDDLIKNYINENELPENSILIYKSFGRYISLRISDHSKDQNIREDLQKLVFKRLGLLVFFLN